MSQVAPVCAATGEARPASVRAPITSNAANVFMAVLLPKLRSLEALTASNAPSMAKPTARCQDAEREHCASDQTRRRLPLLDIGWRKAVSLGRAPPESDRPAARLRRGAPKRDEACSRPPTGGGEQHGRLGEERGAGGHEVNLPVLVGQQNPAGRSGD